METKKNKKYWSGKHFRKVCEFLSLSIILTCASAISVNAQPFEDIDKALNDYSKADISPAKSCDEIGTYKADDIVNIAAEKIPADGATPGFCRVKGMIDPEIAFEVNLPENGMAGFSCSVMEVMQARRWMTL